jgi:tRNA(Ile)-lysidine synthase
MPELTPAERARRRSEDRVRRFMDEHDLWPANDRLVAAVSGGPDSTALLLVLHRLAKRRQLNITVAYFDHQLRGQAAAREERRAVEALARSLDLPLLSGGADVRSEAKRDKRSLEDAARRARYAFLADAASQAGANAVATGHTASDQAETALLHLLRGAGLQGLAGMAPGARWPFAGHDDLTLLRPLLCLTRGETRAYCDAAGAQPVEDESNRSSAYRRNRVRHELLPALERFNPRIEDALVRLAASARDDASYVESVVSGAIEPREDGLQLAREQLSVWPASLRRQALRLALQRLADDGDGFSARHVTALERLVLKGRTGDHLDMPQGLKADLTRDALVMQDAAPGSPVLPDLAVRLTVPGEARIGVLIVGAGLEAPRDAVSAVADATAVGEALTVRGRRPGDRMQPLGMGGTKKLQDILVDAHIARHERDSIPVFENEHGIVWLGSLRLADWARPVPGAPTVTLSYRRA